MSEIIISIPATTANLGPGFDCIGVALNIYNEFKFTLTEDEVNIKITGAEAHRLTTDKTNLLYKSYKEVYDHLGKEAPNVKIEINLNVPLSRGLGSSATAIVGGLIGGNYLAGNPLDLSEIISMAIAMEGHPDNVVPALLGKCQLSIPKAGKWLICEIPWHQDIIPVIAIPNFEVSTKGAREVLPEQITYQDAIFNIAHMGLLQRGLQTGEENWLRIALDDKLHQPYRKKLIQGYELVKSAAISAGAYGMVISGAGPALLALTNQIQVNAVVRAMKNSWESMGIMAEVRSLSIDTKGTNIIYSN